MIFPVGSKVLKPGMESSLSSVPPVMPSAPGNHRHAESEARQQWRERQRDLVANAAGGMFVHERRLSLGNFSTSPESRMASVSAVVQRWSSRENKWP